MISSNCGNDEEYRYFFHKYKSNLRMDAVELHGLLRIELQIRSFHMASLKPPNKRPIPKSASIYSKSVGAVLFEVLT
jgi:hypothetical protein